MTRTLAEIAAEAVDHAMIRNDGNRVHTARELGISVRSLRNWIREHDGLRAKWYRGSLVSMRKTSFAERAPKIFQHPPKDLE